MKLKLSLILAGLCFLTSCTTTEQSPEARHVIVIGIDGMSPDGVRNADTPNMDKMMENGAYTLAARGVLPTSSSPNWASMIMGAGPEQHGITSNSWRFDNHVLPTSVSGSGAFFPTIFKIIDDQKPEMEVGTIYHWEGFNHLFNRDIPDYEKHGSSEEVTTQLAIDYFNDKAPHFMFVHLDHVDGAGHGLGHGTEGYYKSVSKADSLIGAIVDAVEAAGMLDSSVIMVTSDHGGIGYGHGGETPEEIEIPWIIYGKGVKSGEELDLTVNTYDTPATAAMLLGIESPQAWIGRPVKSAFKGYNSPEMKYTAGDTYRKPIISPTGDGYNPSGGLFINEEPVLEIRNPNTSGEVRFTMDGSTPTMDSPIYTDPVKITETTIVHAILFKDGEKVSRMESAYFRVLKNTSGHGLNYKAYEVDEMEMLPDFSKHKPTKTGKTYEFSINDIELPRSEHIAVEFEGFIKIETAGDYQFTAASDDGSKLYINGKELVDNDGNHGVILKDGTVKLEPGLHAIKVEWFNGGGGLWLGAMYEGPGVPRQLIPPNVLYTTR